MAPNRSKNKVTESKASEIEHGTRKNTTHAQPSDSPSTPVRRSPLKKTLGITAHQKQALIDNLQLEITERARRLRAQYNLQAQGMRSRIEIRVNRIPTSLRQMKMEDLMLRCLEQNKDGERSKRRPPVPAKDIPPRSTSLKPAQGLNIQNKSTARSQKRLSDEIAGGKENDVEHSAQPMKRARAGQAASRAQVRPNQVLSPTSSNSRLHNRERVASSAKPQLPRPGSPLKGHETGFSARAAANALSSMVEKSKAARAAGNRMVTTTSKNSWASSSIASQAQGRRPAAASTAKGRPPRPATRNGRRASGNSVASSDGSTGTVVRKMGAAKPSKAGATKATKTGRTTAGGATNKSVAKTGASATSTASTGRVLRKRG